MTAQATQVSVIERGASAHAARFAAMVEAARGHDNVPLALMQAGFTATEILDNHTDIIRALHSQAAQRCLS